MERYYGFAGGMLRSIKKPVIWFAMQNWFLFEI